MARMPQIPAPEFRERPGGESVGRAAGAELPDVSAVERPFEEGAQMAAGVGRGMERLQAQRDEALSRIQDVNDEATALDAAGKHYDQVRDLTAALQEQFRDDPAKATQALSAALPSMTDDAIRNSPTSGAALKTKLALSHANFRATESMKNWELSQGILNSKNKLASAEFSATHGLESLPNGAALNARIRATATPELRKLWSQLTTEGPEKAARGLAQAQVSAWAEQRSAVSPQAALDVIAELRKPDGIAVKYGLESKDVNRALRLAKDAYDGAQKSAAFDMFAANHHALNGLTDLLESNDPKFPAAAYAKRQEVLQLMDANAKRPGLDDKTREKLDEYGRMMLNSLDAAQDAFRKGRGVEQGRIDEEIRRKLLARNAKIFTQGQVSLNKHYEDALLLRHDNLEAFAAGHLSYQTFSLIENGLKKSLGSRDALEAKNVGTIHGAGWFSYATRTPRQAGNQRMDDLFKGPYRKASIEQQNDAREEYMRRLYDAAVSGANVTEKEALEMARLSVESAVGK